MTELWRKLNDEAEASGEDFYVDPDTGYLVATQARLRRIGKCCESGCRHCPYGFVKSYRP